MTQESRPRIDFYKLNTQNSASISRFCCQLTDKVVKMGHSVFIRTKDERETRLLDDMMWTYSDSSRVSLSSFVLMNTECPILTTLSVS